MHADLNRPRQVLMFCLRCLKQKILKGVVAGGAARKGPKRPQPLAPLCKFPGMSGAVAAWEGAPVILDGTVGYRSDLPLLAVLMPT